MYCTVSMVQDPRHPPNYAPITQAYPLYGLRFEDDNRWEPLVPPRHVLEGGYYTHGNVCRCMCGRMRRANESQLNCVCVICGVCNYCSFSGSVQYGLAVSGQLGDVRFQAEQRPDDGHTASLLAPHV